MLGKPVESFVEAISPSGASGLDVPGLTPYLVEAEFVGDLWGGHGSLDVLLVGVNENDGVLEFFIVYHLVEFVTSVFDSISIVRVDDEDDALGVRVIMSPELSDLILTAYIPDVEGDVFVGYLLNIESNGWNRCDDFSELELVEDGGLTSGIETDHEDSHFLVSEHPLPDA